MQALGTSCKAGYALGEKYGRKDFFLLSHRLNRDRVVLLCLSLLGGLWQVSGWL